MERPAGQRARPADLMALPALARESFLSRLEELSPEPLGAAAGETLWAHYQSLREWSPRLSLIGPGTAGEVIERHYGESLAALPWIEPGSPGKLLDVGSGAGFPGFVIAAARPRLEVWLVDSRQRKWAFLRSVAARAALPCHCLDARVAAPLPPEIPAELDLLTLRAVKLPPATLAALLGRLAPSGALLWWRGEGEPELPAGWVAARRLLLGGSERRHLVEVRHG